MRRFLVVLFVVMGSITCTCVTAIYSVSYYFDKTPSASTHPLQVVKAAAHVTPTPFQPVQEVNTAEPLKPTTEPQSESEVEVVPTPEPSFNEYDFHGIRFDSEWPNLKEPIYIIFLMQETSVIMSFTPIIPHNGASDYDPGLGRAGIFADEQGNIAINPHSGCIWDANLKEYIILESELFRRFVEGGDCVDMNEYGRKETEKYLNELKKAEVFMVQAETSVKLNTVITDVRSVEEVVRMEPAELAALLGVELQKRSVVVVTSGRNFDVEPWYSGERWIFILKEDGQ